MNPATLANRIEDLSGVSPYFSANEVSFRHGNSRVFFPRYSNGEVKILLSYRKEGGAEDITRVRLSEDEAVALACEVLAAGVSLCSFVFGYLVYHLYKLFKHGA